MKKNILIAGLMLGALCLTSCNKEENAPINSEKRITVNATAEMAVDTKTGVVYDEGIYKATWNAGDVVGLFTVNADTEIDANVALDGATGGYVQSSFTGTIAAPAADATYDIYTYYPHSIAYPTSTYDALYVDLPVNQYPTKTGDLKSFDPRADILIGELIQKEVTPATTSLDLALRFSRQTSVIMMNFGTIPDGVTGNLIRAKVTFPGKQIAGKTLVDLPNNVITVSSTSGEYSSSVQAIYTDETKCAINDPNCTVFLSMAPIILSASESIMFELETDGGQILTKTVEERPFTFAAGNITHMKDLDLSTWTVTTKKTIKEILDANYEDLRVFTEDWYIEGTVLNYEKYSANSSGKNLILQDGTEAGSGITIYMKNATNNIFAQSDIARVFLKGTKIQYYNGLNEIVLVDDTEVSKAGVGTMPTATPITASQIPAYQSMYVSIANTQTDNSSPTTINTSNNQSINMKTSTDSYVMFIPKNNVILNGKTVPAGNGTLFGIAGVYNNTVNQIYPLTEDSFSGLTGDRFVEYGPASFVGTMNQNVALSDCKITIPISNLATTTSYQVSVTPSGDGATGINAISNQVCEANAENSYTLTLNVTGTPTALGNVVFAVEVKDAAGTSTLATLSASGEVVNGNERKITLDFTASTTYPAGFPTATGTTTGTYTFGGYSFNFACNIGFYFGSSRYLMIGKASTDDATASRIELPAISEYKLKSVKITGTAEVSTNISATIRTIGDTPTIVTGGEAWQFVKGASNTFTLSSTVANTSYQLYILGTKGTSTYNAQIAGLELVYTK